MRGVASVVELAVAVLAPAEGPPAGHRAGVASTVAIAAASRVVLELFFVGTLPSLMPELSVPRDGRAFHRVGYQTGSQRVAQSGALGVAS